MKTSTAILVIVIFIVSCVNFIFANMRQESYKDNLSLLKSKITVLEKYLDVEYIPEIENTQVFPEHYQKIQRDISESIIFHLDTLEDESGVWTATIDYERNK